jgi:hypothetical protein
MADSDEHNQAQSVLTHFKKDSRGEPKPCQSAGGVALPSLRKGKNTGRRLWLSFETWAGPATDS